MFYAIFHYSFVGGVFTLMFMQNWSPTEVTIQVFNTWEFIRGLPENHQNPQDAARCHRLSQDAAICPFLRNSYVLLCIMACFICSCTNESRLVTEKFKINTGSKFRPQKCASQ